MRATGTVARRVCVCYLGLRVEGLGFRFSQLQGRSVIK